MDDAVELLPHGLGAAFEPHEIEKATADEGRVALPIDRVKGACRRIEHEPDLGVALANAALGLEPLAVVAQVEDRADLAVVLHQRPRRADRDDVAAVGAADAPARILDRLAVRHGARERQVGEGIGVAVEGEEMIGVGIVIGRDIERLDAVEALGGGIDEQQFARRPGDDDAFGQLLQQRRAIRRRGDARRHRRRRRGLRRAR